MARESGETAAPTGKHIFYERERDRHMDVKKVPVDDYTVVVTLSAEDANHLYNNICSLLRSIGVYTAGDRGSLETARYSAIYALYDGLHAARIDGSDRSSS